MKYQLGITGGTFDRLHVGHKALLHTAFTNADRVIIGVSSEKIHNHKQFASNIQSFDVRKQALVQHLKEQKYFERAELITIDDIYGSSLTDKAIQVTFATDDTKPNVETINAARLKKGFPAMDVVHVAQTFANDGELISSSRIRKGEIDQEGFSYATLFTTKEKYSLPENDRELLRKPFGKVYDDISVLRKDHKDAMIIAVGDVVSLSLYKSDHQAALSIVDLKTRRAMLKEDDIEIFYAMASLTSARNAAGTIEQNAAEKMQKALQMYRDTKEAQTIVIAGEEDLLTIPAILLAPLESIVVYGQYDLGVVAVQVTEKKKQEVRELFEKFE